MLATVGIWGAASLKNEMVAGRTQCEEKRRSQGGNEKCGELIPVIKGGLLTKGQKLPYAGIKEIPKVYRGALNATTLLSHVILCPKIDTQGNGRFFKGIFFILFYLCKGRGPIWSTKSPPR